MAETPTMEALLAFSKPIKTNPILATVNGIGLGFAGVALRHTDLEADLFVRMHWFKFVFAPILPLGIYLLSHPIGAKGRPMKHSYYIHRAVQLRGVRAVWGNRGVLLMLLSAWGITLVGLAVVFGATWALTLTD